MNWIIDSGHGWLKVKINDLLKSGVAHKISSFSYINGSHVYLEEDCDASIYLLAIDYKHDIPCKICSGDSVVRSYKRFPQGSFKQLSEAIS